MLYIFLNNLPCLCFKDKASISSETFPFHASTSSPFQREELEGIYHRRMKAQQKLLIRHITVFPRRRAGKPESWVPWTQVLSAQWYRWRTPTGPGSCSWHPSHLKTHIWSKLTTRRKEHLECSVSGCLCDLQIKPVLKFEVLKY